MQGKTRYVELTILISSEFPCKRRHNNTWPIFIYCRRSSYYNFNIVLPKKLS